MFEYLQKFKNLSPSLREVVSSARATQVISELEKKYDVDLNALVIKIMVKEINWTGLSEFLAQEHHLAVAQAVALQAELAERLFKPATQYLGISPQKQLQKFSRQELEHELPAPVAPEKPQLRERQTLPAIQPVASAEQVEKISPQVLQKAGITDRQSVESVRLTSIMQTFFKGIRDSIDTRETLLKQKAAGGLALDAAKADAVMALLKAAKQGKVAAAPTIKKSASPFDSLEQIRDVEYKFPFGWSELEGIANRTDFDLKQHTQYSGKDLQYFDDTTKEKLYPYIIEPSGGVDRALLAFLVDGYYEEKVKDETRVVLKFSKELAPIKIAVLPLLKNRTELVELAKKIYEGLRKDYLCVYDDTASIGKLYRRQDEIGTLFCITVDVQSLEDSQATVRDRDTMKQERILVDKLKEYFRERLV